MRVLFDTNVILDLLLDREPFVDTASTLVALVESGTIVGFLGATTFTTIHYLATKAVGRVKSQRHVETLLDLFGVAPIDESVLRSALNSGIEDYEDAVLHAAALSVRVDGIVTRNVRDFKRATARIYSPEELLALIPG